ncbi:acyltransferase [Methylomonas sp. SURF-2]|uniref:Acyltransferase n=1 Tax=Methylomonas subterranea TaxID=2952225 RepID=A0ABT1TJJ1_9GAMM|nr:acyltransferase family protein [Methylomonas sp. SURF-2]MCQ8105489.1 acyltransferase [Methylomonas sp. SURF-2]
MTLDKTITYRPDLQGLRAISIILVVLNHAGVSLVSGGFVGVDVFFVLSGYLISGLLIKEYMNVGSIDLLQFIARRLRRLLPALFVMLSVVVLISSLLLSNYEAWQQTASVVYATTWTSNLFFSFSTINYFEEIKTKDLFLHTWSLGVEEQFYITWPVMILLIFIALKKLRQGALDRSGLLAMLTVLFLGSLGLSWYWMATNPLWSFYMMPSRIWQFALGAVTFVWFQPKMLPLNDAGQLYFSPWWGRGLSALGAGLIFGAATFLTANETYPGYWALLPSVGAVLIISAGYFNRERAERGILAHPVLVWVGDRSYSWYLWHWPLLMLGFSWGLHHRFSETTGLVALSFLFAIASYRYVELPFWKGRFRHQAPLRVILLSILAMLTMIWGAQNYLKPPPVDEMPKEESYSTKARSDLPIIYTYGCDAWYGDANLSPCVIGGTDAEKTVVLLGDSIGAQWFSMFPGIFQAPKWRIVVLTKSSCPMVDEDFFYSRIGKIYTVCTEWRNKVLDYLESIRPDIVFLGSAATYDFTKEQWENGSARILARLTKIAGRVVVIPGTYPLSFDGPGCLERDFSSHQLFDAAGIQDCRENISNKQPETVAGYLGQAVKPFSNAALLDLNDLVCPNEQCSAQDADGIVVFRDQQHLTDTFVKSRVSVIRKRLEMLGLEMGVAH